MELRRGLVLHDLCVILVREIVPVHSDASTIKVNRAQNRFRRFFRRADRELEGSRSPRCCIHLLRCARFFSILARREATKTGGIGRMPRSVSVIDYKRRLP
jgi:hypothetical protein